MQSEIVVSVLDVLIFQARLHQNQPYDESLEVPDAEEIASTYSPTPRVANPPGERKKFVSFHEDLFPS